VGVFHEPPLSPFAFNCCFIASVNYGLTTRQSNGNIVSKYLPIKKGRENEKVPCSSFVAGLVVGFCGSICSSSCAERIFKLGKGGDSSLR